MNYNEVMNYLSELRPYTEEQMAGCEEHTNMKALLKELSNPEEKIKFIHIAGTNGKGSTASILENILCTAGINVGAYKAPGFDRYNRVIRVCNQEISDEDLIRFCTQVIEAWDRLNVNRKIALNELMFAVALLFFVDKGVEIAIVKVVIGGAHDITNVIPAPILTLFTPIGLDHCDILGHSIEDIAKEKAGIIKEGSTVISTIQPPEAELVLRLTCMEKNVPYFSAPNAFYKGFNLEKKAQSFKVLNQESSRIPKQYTSLKKLSEDASKVVFETQMLGVGQLMNAALALGIGGLLIKYGYDMNIENLKKGAFDVVWPGSFEIISEKPYVIVDAAHNVSSVEVLVESLNLYFPEKKVHFIVESPIAHKSAGMILALKDKAADIRVVNEYETREQAEKFDLLVESAEIDVKRCNDVKGALSDALSNATSDDIVVAFGSLALAMKIKDMM
ncbi:MAG: hypothetical protein K5851_02445 [Lachnospiraceae bacterium]|nr:hypothetical protein [Lachnospiraceae bacterium]